MKYCFECGEEVPDGAKFCPECGTDLTVLGDESATSGDERAETDESVPEHEEGGTDDGTLSSEADENAGDGEQGGKAEDGVDEPDDSGEATGVEELTVRRTDAAEEPTLSYDETATDDEPDDDTPDAVTDRDEREERAAGERDVTSPSGRDGSEQNSASTTVSEPDSEDPTTPETARAEHTRRERRPSESKRADTERPRWEYAAAESGDAERPRWDYQPTESEGNDRPSWDYPSGERTDADATAVDHDPSTVETTRERTGSGTEPTESATETADSAAEPTESATKTADSAAEPTESGYSTLITSGVAGIGAFVVTYLLVYLAVVVDVLVVSDTNAGSGDVVPTAGVVVPVPDVGIDLQMAFWEFVGWVLVGGLNADFETDATDGTVDPFAPLEGVVTSELYSVVVLVVLLVAGYVAASIATRDRTGTISPTETAKYGGLIAVGYVIAAVAVATLFRFEVGAFTLTPELTATATYAGGFGVVAGAVGGYAVGYRSEAEPAGNTPEPEADAEPPADGSGTDHLRDDEYGPSRSSADYEDRPRWDDRTGDPPRNDSDDDTGDRP